MRGGINPAQCCSDGELPGRRIAILRLRYGLRIPLLHNHEDATSSYVVIWDAM